MAELILTNEEIAAATWFELSDETVGKMCKAQGGKLLKAAKEADMAIDKACALFLMSTTADQGANETEHRIVNEKYGEWMIVARKIG